MTPQYVSNTHANNNNNNKTLQNQHSAQKVKPHTLNTLETENALPTHTRAATLGDNKRSSYEGIFASIRRGGISIIKNFLKTTKIFIREKMEKLAKQRP